MKTLLTFFTIIIISQSILAQNVFINELSYQDVILAERGVEIAGPAGTDLDGWYMEFRDDNNATYHTETISGSTPIDDEAASGRGGIWIPIANYQNNDNRSIILYDNANTPRDTVSYGTTPPIPGANFLTGVVQTVPGITPQNLSDDSYNGWWVLQPASKGDLNTNQLPVELISFKGNLINNSIVLLDWMTASETNNSHFEIEKSTNGTNYERIGIVEGHGTTFETQVYEFEDNFPKNGQNYYRLKQVDEDGAFEYSEIVSVKKRTDINIIVSPNPLPRNSKLNIITPNYTPFDFVIYDITGQIVKIYPSITTNHVTMNDLEPGVYLYQIQQNQTIIKTDKIIIIE